MELHMQILRLAQGLCAENYAQGFVFMNLFNDHCKGV